MVSVSITRIRPRRHQVVVIGELTSAVAKGRPLCVLVRSRERFSSSPVVRILGRAGDRRLFVQTENSTYLVHCLSPGGADPVLARQVAPLRWRAGSHKREPAPPDPVAAR